MEDVVYGRHFDGNEWFVIGIFLLFTAAIRLFPRPLSPLQTTFNFLIGIALGLIFDHTLHVPPLNYYDIGDRSKYEWFDIVTYAMYAPFGYWFIFWKERLRVRGTLTIPYILLWSGLAVGFEWLGVLVGEFHYRNGYRFLYSFPIYLFLISLHLGLYRLVFARDRRRVPAPFTHKRPVPRP
ncbi:hypothetical protein [Cohnella candidum]|uniref:Uncharacterized protein n=1 Tax=Cohnella candidum TaxID=2674991 RepID=A0A3G3K3L6_9BACL|nr:hypothetical protein [Cohnella candidum]AYQ74970.1 hypothetical protein EAV92_21880 [Cohnella candidum]